MPHEINLKFMEWINYIQYSAKIGIWEFDLIDNTENWSDYIYTLLGISKDIALTREKFLEFIHDDEKERVRQVVESSCTTNSPYEIYYQLVTKEKKVRYVLEKGQPKTKNGVITHVIGIIHDITETKERELQNEKYRSLFTNNPDLVYSFDLNGLFTDLNTSVEEVTGYTYEEIINSPYLSIVDAKSREVSAFYFEEAKKGNPQRYEIDIINKNGELINLLATKFPIIMDGKVVGVYGLAKDVTVEKKALAELHETKEKFRVLVEYSLAGVYMIQNSTFIYANPKAEEILGEKLIGKDVLSYVFEEDKESIKEKLAECLNNGSTETRYEVRLISKRGQIIHADIYGSRAIINGEAVLLGTFLDNTTEKEIAAKNEYIANHDYLTNLKNRYKFETDLHRFIEFANDSNQEIALLYIDFNNFKYVNDKFGHDGGDKLLVSISERLSDLISENVYLYRIGGDEFAIVLTKVKGRDNIEAFIKRLLAAFDQAFVIYDTIVFIDPSIGVSIFPEIASSKEELMKQADTAMYHAKEEKYQRYAIFDVSLTQTDYSYVTLDSDLRKALLENQFILYFQPKVNLEGNMIGAETLIRWKHPQQGYISPEIFIPFAEDAGLIYQIDRYVQQEALKKLSQWLNMGYKVVPLSVNISARTISNPKFVPQIEEYMSAFSIDPSLLEVELTETSLITFTETTKFALERLKDLGITISLDDFGKGYSSLSYLNKFKDIISILKIDKSFIQTLPEQNKLVNSIIFLAKQLDMNVVAEGIETKDQYTYLKTTQCDAMQGYYFSRPLPADEFEELLKS